MDANSLQLLGLEELFEEGDSILEVEDILGSIALPPMANPWYVPTPPIAAPAEEPQRGKGLRRALGLAANIAIYILCAAVIAVCLTLRFSGQGDSIMGYHIYHVVSGSMAPTPGVDGKPLKGAFSMNDAIIVKNTVPELIKKGDIITFWQDDSHTKAPITHRVMEVQDLGGALSFYTKGDANSSQDPSPVPGSRVIGVKMFTLPKLGGALKAAREHPWITVGMSAGVMCLVFTIYIISLKRSGKKENG